MFVTFVSITIFNKVLKIKNLGEGKKMFQFTMISIAAAAITGSAFAGPILNIKFDVDGKKTSVAVMWDQLVMDTQLQLGLWVGILPPISRQRHL